MLSKAVGYVVVFFWYLIVAVALLPFYGIPITVKAVRRSRAKRQISPKHSRGVRITLTCVRLIGWLFFIIALPLYGVYYIATSDVPKKKAKKKDDLSWIDRFEGFDALFN